MNIIEWAKNELEILERGCKEQDSLKMQQLFTKNVLEIVKKFSEQGHSGFSASYVSNLIKRLLDWKPITSLKGTDDEWGEVQSWNEDNNTQQNLRCSAVFRDNFDNSTAHYIYGKIFSDDGGRTWFTNSNSFVPITFPYYVPDQPQYIYLDTKGNEITKEQAKELFKEISMNSDE